MTAEQPQYEVGQIVRHTKNNNGTGQIAAVHIYDTLGRKQTVNRQITYAVTWLDQEGTPTSNETERTLAPSMRGAPSFDDPEAAAAWLDGQAAPGEGAWVDAVEDATALAADQINRMVAGVITEAEDTLRVLCGEEGCGCLDCTCLGEGAEAQHFAGVGCTCEKTDPKCGCVPAYHQEPTSEEN